MKEKELRNHAVCSNCGNKVLASGLPLFYRVTVERFGIDLKAMERQQGLTMMLGGNAGLAMVMGADEDLATPLMGPPAVLTICETCANGDHGLMGLMALIEQT